VQPNGARAWQPLDSTQIKTLADGEEVLPTFPLNYLQDDQRKRRLLVGVIPVGRRETYLAATKSDQPAAAGGPKTARKMLLRKEVIEPWKNLVTRAAAVGDTLDFQNSDGLFQKDLKPNQMLDNTRVQIQTVSWYVLLDFAKFLRDYLPNVWAQLQSSPQNALLNQNEQVLLDALRNIQIKNAATSPNLKSALGNGKNYHLIFAADLPDALRRALAAEAVLEAANSPFAFSDPPSAWPNFLFPLADPQFSGQAPQPQTSTLANPSPDEADELQELGETDVVEKPDDPAALVVQKLDVLAALVVRAMPDDTTQPQPAVPLAAQRPADALEGWFVIRCVYLRPGCGPLQDDVVSERTDPFLLAGFFDPDAPARPIRIGLPIDTTPAGLRKFDRNTALVISDTLCGQIARLKGLTLGDLIRTVLPWPLHKDLDLPDKGPCGGAGASFGMICSLSIPIITLCALILLMVMVSLLDFIFRWLPFFILCFPVPGMRAKK
jgi:hypothetical protein